MQSWLRLGFVDVRALRMTLRLLIPLILMKEACRLKQYKTIRVIYLKQ